MFWHVKRILVDFVIWRGVGSLEVGVDQEKLYIKKKTIRKDLAINKLEK